MRRLAKRTRNDKVLSSRDYQILHDHQAVVLRPTSGSGTAVFAKVVPARPANSLIAVGVYLRADREGVVKVTVQVPGAGTASLEWVVSTSWGRHGIACDCEVAGDLVVEVHVPAAVGRLHVWGLAGGEPPLPGLVAEQVSNVEQLNDPPICPETFYFQHDAAIGLDVVDEWWAEIEVDSQPGAPIQLKKCAYCQRFLPLDLTRPSALAFHKHQVKRTGHQNECRACKKWKINDALNSLRTVDQLHESSSITRERKLFLREPAILKEIKDRRGAGLKSLVWLKFGKKCFRCGAVLALKEVQLDHTRPMAYLWPIDEHATCLCASCNNHKKDRFPVDVYSPKQRERLSKITGLSVEELGRKEVNPVELARIRADIVAFSREWDARSFNTTARKVKELLPSVDLFDDLRRADPPAHEQLIAALAERPDFDDVEE